MRVLFLMFVALLAGCGQREAVPAAPTPEIAWFQGSVDEAFAEAKQSDRPVFLYWGAVWCPYCQQLKSSVFTRRDFIDKSQLFVPVYLDGDNPGAQKWGEQLKVSGYPTVLILKPDGTELMRVAGGMDVERYSGILDLALEDAQPVAAIVAGLENSTQPLSTRDCARLAYNGFGLDDAYTSDPQRMATLLDAAADRCPADSAVERARLQIEAADASPEPQRVVAVVQLLGQTELAVSVADALFALDDDFFAAARQSATIPETELQARWFRVMEAAALDPRYSESDRLFALVTHLRVAKYFDALSPELENAARAHVEEVLGRKHDAFTRASVVNAALYVFDTLGDDDRVYALALSEMETATAPYYLMPDLASIDEKRGRTDAALSWLERAYNESKGPATRFQWGTSYVAGLIRMRPDDEMRIREVTLSVLNELEGPDRLYQRTNARIARLERVLREWNADGKHAATLEAISQRMQAVCVQAAESDRSTCEGFLAPNPA